ncbi:hypothetical protein AOC36_05975 [Erysipelothrix larvae]|uniref:ECF transporter S component n=1 Tax=Erysipelothrix larvae TaxID=1514105 RepID=A0A0X8H027_9FIRM|nr:ECF transporter S component [Erysipelothrix larvae]AMC93545.1 hypothetical protein AOC36_05975 [Erysipelothrix larvae]
MKKNYEIKRTQTIVYIALMTALVTSVTIFTAVAFPNGGYFNLGDVVIAILATIAPVRQVLVAAALGSALADLLTGYAHYMLFTAFIKGSEVLVIYIFRKLLKTKLYPIPFLLSAMLMLVGYGIVDSFILGDYAFFASIAANLTQGIVAFVVPTAVYPWIRKTDFSIKGMVS